MKFWLSALSEHHQRWVVLLEERHCVFVWRDQHHRIISAEPLRYQECRLEIWLADRLLCHSELVPARASETDVRSCSAPLICQAIGLLNLS